jgi:chromosomal replication initiation ATPase DnaA
MQEFQSADALLAHYAAVREKFKPPMTVRMPAAPRPAVIRANQLDDKVKVVARDPAHVALDAFLEEISCGKLIASPANAMRLAKLLDARYRLPNGSVEGRGQAHKIVAVRHRWFWILVRQWGWAYYQTGVVTNRDHTTIMNGITKHEKVRKSCVDQTTDRLMNG